MTGNLLQEPRIRFEDGDVHFSALQSFCQNDAEFADALIVYKTLKVALDGREAPLSSTPVALTLFNCTTLRSLECRRANELTSLAANGHHSRSMPNALKVT